MAIVTQFPTANEGNGVNPNWTNPNNAHADDDVDASVSSLDVAGSTNWKTFGFDAVLPLTITIDAVKIITEHQDGLGVDPGASTVHALVNDVDQGAHDTTSTVRVVTTTDVTADRAWTRANLLNATFKVWVVGGSGSSAPANLDYVKVEVTYTLALPPYYSGRF